MSDFYKFFLLKNIEPCGHVNFFIESTSGVKVYEYKNLNDH